MSKEMIRYITYRGKKYPSREIYSPSVGDTTVSTIALESVLLKDCRSGNMSVKKQAEAIEDTIAFYLDTDEQLELSTEEIVGIMKQNGYEI